MKEFDDETSEKLRQDLIVLCNNYSEYKPNEFMSCLFSFVTATLRVNNLPIKEAIKALIFVYEQPEYEVKNET